MFSKYSHNVHGLLQHLISWTDPAWWIWTSISLFILFSVHLAPLVLPEDNHKTKDRIFLLIRKAAFGAVVGLGMVYPLILYIAFGLASGKNSIEASTMFKEWFADMLAAYWAAPVAGLLGGIVLNFSWHRYGEPYLSNVGRGLRVKQHEDKQSDIREEITNLQPKDFKPDKYFKEGYYFLGLDENNRPIYVPAKLFEETHLAGIGPTRFGKGVLLGVILKQSILRGNTTIYIDPKEDENLPYVMQSAAAEVGRPFVYLDLNPAGKGHWHPFKGGSDRDRRSRIISAFHLEHSGTTADVYKSKERGYVDRILKSTDGSIREMLDAVTAFTDGDDLSQLRDSLREWSGISTFMAPKKKDGHSIEKSLLNNAVVYVKGSIDDGVVRRATALYIAEVVQEIRRLRGQLKHHTTFAIDELRFVISNEVVDAMATIAGSKTNMLLCTQAVDDLMNVQDQTINGRALQQSFITNCQFKVIYKCGTDETADWAESISGTQWLRTARNEKTEVNRWGAEKWDKTRSFEKTEAPLISKNKLLALPPRVAVLYRPDDIAKTMFTCWVHADKSVCSWAKKETIAVEKSELVSDLESK